jgi:hypothetical protein
VPVAWTILAFVLIPISVCALLGRGRVVLVTAGVTLAGWIAAVGYSLTHPYDPSWPLAPGDVALFGGLFTVVLAVVAGAAELARLVRRARRGGRPVAVAVTVARFAAAGLATAVAVVAGVLFGALPAEVRPSVSGAEFLSLPAAGLAVVDDDTRSGGWRCGGSADVCRAAVTVVVDGPPDAAMRRLAAHLRSAGRPAGITRRTGLTDSRYERVELTAAGTGRIVVSVWYAEDDISD